MAIALALAACALCIEAGLFFAGMAGPWLQSHMTARWFVPACNVAVFGCLVITGLQRKKTVVEDERLTPGVRRDPKTGLRLL